MVAPYLSGALSQEHFSLRPSKNKCYECQMSGKLTIQVSFALSGVTCILEKRLPNLILRIFVLFIFLRGWRDRVVEEVTNKI